MTKKILGVSLLAAVTSVAVFIYVQKKKKAKRKNMPINFI